MYHPKNPILHRYHERCLQLFENPKEMQSAQRDDPIKSPEECAIRYVARSIRNLPDKSWTSLELHELYQNNRGNEGNRSRFITKLTDHMKNEIYVFTCPGMASILMLKQKASNMFQLVSENVIGDGDDDTSIQQIARKIQEDVQKLPNGKSEYSTIGTENLFDECSSTLLTLLSKISPNFEKFSCSNDWKYRDFCAVKKFYQFAIVT